MSGSSRSRQELLEEEWLLVRHSGELPEIAFQSALYCLAEDPEGPRLRLHPEEIHSLREAAIDRYREILLRDLCYEKRELTLYRGVKRAIFNWRRLVDFCRREERAFHNFREPMAKAFLILLQQSAQTAGKVDLALVFNCTFDEISLFAQELEIRPEQIPEAIRHYCLS